jgi:hypothetical protein
MTSVAPSASRRLAASACSGVQPLWSLPVTNSVGQRMWASRERWRARYRGPDGRERSKTFDRRVDADRWLAGVSFAIARGEWTDPARARVTLGDWSRNG